MVIISKLAVFLGAATTATAIFWDMDLIFARFRDESCQDLYGMNYVHSDHCFNGYTNGASDPVFSFKYKPRRKHDKDDKRRGCKVTVFDKLDCMGESYSLGDARATFGNCGTIDFNSTWGYQSLSVVCEDHKIDTSDKHKYISAPSNDPRCAQKLWEPLCIQNHHDN
ncbi:hypothetical protein LTR17_017230 [Elasticomyces elasticus]|nr:hypothetical protein LTR17_017230 [Elasticomyces elasticus]